MKVAQNTSGPIEANYQKMDAPPLAQKFANLESKKPAAKANISEEGKELAKKQGATEDTQSTEASGKKSKSKAGLQEQKDYLTNFYAKKLATAIKKLETDNTMPAEIAADMPV